MKLVHKQLGGPDVPLARVNADELKRTHEEMAKQIDKTNQQVRERGIKRKRMAPQLEEGDKVYLSTKNLRSTRPCKKFDHKKVGPFLIKQRKGPVNYELELPKGARIHPVFHTSLLEPAHP